MKNHVRVHKYRSRLFAPFHWAVLDRREGPTATVVSYHRTHADAVHAAHYWATRYARAEQVAAAPARHHTPSPA